MATSAATASSAPDLGLLLSQASHALTVELTARLEALDISPRGYCVLSKALNGDLSQGEIAALCDLDKTTMVVTIDQLEAAGLAERRASATDRRARIIAVTRAGERIVARAGEIVERVYEDILAGLPAPDRTAFVGGLERLVARHDAEPVQCARAPRRRSTRGG